MKRKALRSLVVMMLAVMVFAMMPVTVSAATKTPGKVTITSVTSGKVSTSTNKTWVRVKWKKAKNAKGYIIYMKRGEGKWVKQKKVGRLCRSLKITNTPAGRVYIKVRAVNKKKLGKFSAVKTKYIKSPLTLQQYVNKVEPSMKNVKIYGGKVSFNGKQMIVSYDVYDCFSDAAEFDFWDDPPEEVKTYVRNYLIENMEPKEVAAYYRKRAKLYCGITSFEYVIRATANGNVVPGTTAKY